MSPFLGFIAVVATPMNCHSGAVSNSFKNPRFRQYASTYTEKDSSFNPKIMLNPTFLSLSTVFDILLPLLIQQQNLKNELQDKGSHTAGGGRGERGFSLGALIFMN